VVASLEKLGVSSTPDYPKRVGARRLGENARPKALVDLLKGRQVNSEAVKAQDDLNRFTRRFISKITSSKEKCVLL
jgi:hypothetical protein